MRNLRNMTVRCVMMGVLGAIGVSVSGDAKASGTCSDGFSTYNYTPFAFTDYGTLSANPTVYSCSLPVWEGGTGNMWPVLTAGPGVNFLAQDQSSSTTFTYAIEGSSLNNTGVYGFSQYAGVGVNGSNGGTGIGVVGIGDNSSTAIPSSGYGVWGTSASYDGVHGDTNNGASAVGGYNAGTGNGGWFGNGNTGTCTGTACVGVYGSSTKGYGVYGTSTSSDGVHGAVDNSSSGVAGENTGAGYGVYASANGNYGLYATTTNYTALVGVVTSNSYSGAAGVNFGSGYGVYGKTSGGSGVYAIDQGSSSSGYGVYGISTLGTGTYGTSYSGYGVYGNSGTSYAGYFTGGGTYSAFFNKDIWVNGASLGPSDERLKKNIASIPGALDQLMRLQGRTFEWKEPENHNDATGTQFGFIAQEVEKVYPGWVKTETATGFKGVSVAQIEALEVESIRTLKMQNDLLTDRVKELESGRQMRVSGVNLNGVGFGVGGIAIAVAVFLGLRRRQGEVKA